MEFFGCFPMNQRYSIVIALSHRKNLVKHYKASLGIYDVCDTIVLSHHICKWLTSIKLRDEGFIMTLISSHFSKWMFTGSKELRFAMSGPKYS